MTTEEKLLKRAFLITTIVWVAVFCSALPVFHRDQTIEQERPSAPAVSIDDDLLYTAAR